MKTDPRKPAVAVALTSALMALPVLGAGYSSDSSSSTMSGGPTGSSATTSEKAGSTGTKPPRSTANRTPKSSEKIGGAMDLMVRADTNKDGAVTKDEVQKLNPRLATHFEQADANRDGRLNLKEFEKLLTYQDQDAKRVGSTSGHAPRASTAGGNVHSK